MKEEKNTPTFGKNKKRRIKCRKCGAYIASKNGGAVYTYLGEKKIRPIKCFECGYAFKISPPKIERRDEKTGRNVISYNADEDGELSVQPSNEATSD